MGQQVSFPSGPESGSRRRLRPLPPSYVPLCDLIKAGDSASAATASSSDDIKDAMSKILEFGAALSNLPKASEVLATLPMRNAEQQLQDLMSSVDTTDELFRYISSLVEPAESSSSSSMDARRSDVEDGTAPGLFEARVASYVKKLQVLYQVIKKEKYRHEQSVLAAQASATSLRTVAPPPLPLPTQNCLTMGWDLVVLLLRATRKDNPDQYLCALQMIKDSLRTLKPTTYADSLYLAPSAATVFNLLGDTLGELASFREEAPPSATSREPGIGASTIEALAEVALARGSLPMLLFVVRWLMEQKPKTAVNMDISILKLAALKEQPFYGHCEASGELYCCGQNSYGELGIGDDIERHQLTSVGLCGWDDIRQVVSGNEILALLTNDGVVLTCGLNKSGQCGQGHFDERVMLLRPVAALRSQKIKFIAASNGCEHMIALTESGLAYSWGYNDRGQLGHENLTTKIHLPKLIESMKDKKLGFAAVSYHHSAVVTDTGELYTFGMNDCGQLGLDHTQHQSTPQLVRALEGQEVTMVSCGLYHTVICTASGELFSCGKNDYGQLGLGHGRQVKIPSLVGLSNEMISYVACGYYHSIVVTSSGRTYSFGRNDYGQLGVGSKIHQNAPSVVTLTAITRMVRATCGCYHTVLLSEQGGVFVFGRNNKGQLGNRSSADSLLPVPLKVRPEKNTRRCIDVAAGFYTTSLIVERKRENDDGEAQVMDQTIIVAVCGRVDIDRSGEIEGLSNFGSISTTGLSLFHGKWFYEVEVVTSGLIQIGWIDGYFQGSSDQGEGVGDHSHSWSYDGNRQRRWNSGSSSYGEKWKAGDIIGCLLDLTTSEMIFFRNGINLGTAFSGFKCSVSDKRSGLMPGISLERGEIIRVNLGHQPFAYPPTIVHDFDSVSRAVMSPASSALVKSIESVASGDSGSHPPRLQGSATVVVKQKLFVIGGVIADSSDSALDAEPTTHVWVYHIDQKRWERWSDFPIPIQNHQAVAIDDGHILVIGGENKSATSRHMDLYKCATAKGVDGSLPAWSLIQGALGAATSMPTPRAHHVAATIRVRLDSVVFMFGGKSAENEVLGDVWYLSVEDYSWSRLPSSIALDPGPRVGCSVAVIGECVYLFGGQDKDDKLRADLWRYNTFDRQWHMCHEDNIFVQKESLVDAPSERSSREEFNPHMPDPRAHYSICSDLGNIWVLGGLDKSGQHLRDLWCYSTTSQKWLSVETSWMEGMKGSASAALFVETGAVIGLASTSHCCQEAAESGAMYLFGGDLVINGAAVTTNEVYSICPVDTIRSYSIDAAKTVTTTGKSAHILSILRSNSIDERRQQSCAHEAHDSAICLLAHLDRLAGNDALADDTESIQLSRCTHRGLCVDPKESTFDALLKLLRLISTPFLAANVAESESTAFFTQVLFPLLATLRLLKLNFFELIRSGIGASTIGLDSSAESGLLVSIRDLLFEIVQDRQMPALSTEAQWFYHAVKQEASAVIYHGFSVLFPSLLDRLQIMNKLLNDASLPTGKKLLPMLVPCFASAKMLFQLMNDTEQLFSTSEVSATTTSTVITFMGTLMDSLWHKSKLLIEGVASNEVTSLSSRKKELEAIEQTDEFKCLNVILRAALFWCSCATKHGWTIVEGACLKLVEYILELLTKASTVPRHEILFCAQHSLPGRLLPFLLLSAFSLPAVRGSMAVLLTNFWPSLEELITKIHPVLTELTDHSTRPLSNRDHEQSDDDRPSADSLNDSTGATVTNELRVALSLEAGTPLTYGDILRRFWLCITESADYQSWKVKDLPSGFELRRVTIPSKLVKLFGTETMLVKYQRESPETSVAPKYDGVAVCFLPSLTVLSQHISPEGSSGIDASIVQVSETVASMGTTLSRDATVDECNVWLQDVQNILVWVGSGYSAALVAGDEFSSSTEIDSRWHSSPLFKGGLEESAEDPDAGKCERNNTLIQEIIDNVGTGKKLLDRVRNALDPGSRPANGNPQLRATRLKRQDSVEATLEKSGGFEAVDRAVRVTFAVLLKHSNVSYSSDPLAKDGSPSDTVIDAWRAALTLRRWIVREQQKLAAAASETTTLEALPGDAYVKERQQAMYNTVCEPIIRRAQLLLQLAPACTASVPSTTLPMKLLPGISVPNKYELNAPTQSVSKSPTDSVEREEQQPYARQLQKLMETKTAERIEEEDERLQADVFAFIQQLPPKVSDPGLVETQVLPPSLEDVVRRTLTAQQLQARQRLKGLKTFRRLLEGSASLPRSISRIIPMLSSTFKRVQDLKDSSDNGLGSSAVVKVHYLSDLEFAGAHLCDAIADELFDLMESLLQQALRSLNQINQITEVPASVGGATLPSGLVEQATHEMLLVLETFSLPYRSDDWRRIHHTSLAASLTELSGWKSWKRAVLYESPEGCTPDASSGQRYPIISAGAGSKYPNIICSRQIAMGTDLHHLTLVHKQPQLVNTDSTDMPSASFIAGGLAVFNRALMRGRWYWEVSVKAQDVTPVFVGVTSGAADLNCYDGSVHEHSAGIFLTTEESRVSSPFSLSMTSRMSWPQNGTLGVLLNWEEKRVEYYTGSKRVCIVALRQSSFPCGCFPTIGISSSEIFWDLTAPVPPKIWCSSVEFQFPSPVISGALLAVPFDGSAIAWDGKRSCHTALQFVSGGTVHAAGDASASNPRYETLVASEGFSGGSLFIEVRIISAGRDGRTTLAFGIVGRDFDNSNKSFVLEDSIGVKCNNLEESNEWSHFGVLFDFEKGSVTIYADHSDPVTSVTNLSRLQTPMFPAVSALCNGCVFDVNFHPQPRPELSSSAFRQVGPRINQQVSSCNEVQIGKALQLEIISCDGGEFSASHGAKNCLTDDVSVYSSSKSSNVNLVLRHEVDTPMCVSYMTIRGPGPEYSSPVRRAVVFITSSPPVLSRYEVFDDMSPEEFAALPFPPNNGQCIRDELLPVAFFVLDGSCSQNSRQLAHPVTGRYILVKFLCPSAGTNIDVGFVGFCGMFERENGPGYTDVTATIGCSCDECKLQAIAPGTVFYSPRSGDAIKLCASCYDDNRGDLDEPHYALTSPDQDDMRTDSNALVLCLPRRVWNDKIESLVDMAKKAKQIKSGLSIVDGRSTIAHSIPDSLNSGCGSNAASATVAYEDCELFSCGQNNYGELCLGHCNSTSKLEHVPFFSAKSIRDISGGNEVLAVVMNDGSVYTCGLNKSGQCGNGTFEERVIIATPVRALSGIPVTMVAAANGCEHMLAVTADGAVYSWGYNDRGQLGLGSTISKSHTPRLIESLQEKYFISYAAVSYHHSAVVASTGELLTFGMNDCGQLGLDHTQHQHTPQLVDALTSQMMVKVACGLYHTIVTTTGGDVYSFGKNDYGQLGLGHARNVKVPSTVKISFGESDEKVVAISCGYYHTVAITEKGKLITWGRNDYGQLGIGSKEHKNTPQYVPLPLASKIKSTSCGCYHTLLLLSNGRVMVFGRNNKGQLGASSRTLPSADLPLPIPSNALANDDVVRVAAGFYSSYILTGRSIGDSEQNAADDGVQAKDLPEHTCIANSEALFESLMKEIDSRCRPEEPATRGPAVKIKRENVRRKLPLLKLHAGAWAMIRALMYQSLIGRNRQSKASPSICASSVNPVLRFFVVYLVEALTHSQSEAGTAGLPTERYVSLKDVCIGLLKDFGSSSTMVGQRRAVDAHIVAVTDGSSSHLFRNQLLWVLLNCGSTNADVGAIIGSNQDVTSMVVAGMNSPDLTTATICIRLAMFVFPLHSVSSINKLHRSLQPGEQGAGDILTALLILVGLPLILRPRLCSHELGLEASSTVLCQSAKCGKGICFEKELGVGCMLQSTMEKAHIAEVKSAEAVGLLRYMTLFPTWRVAVNASLRRGFTKTQELGEMLDAIYTYYSSAACSNVDCHFKVESSVYTETTADTNEVHDENWTDEAGALRKPETTSSPEVEEVSAVDRGSNKSPQDLINARDKEALRLWQAAKHGLDNLAVVMAAVTIVGGHVEGLREYATVSMEEDESTGQTASGTLIAIKRGSRGELVGDTVNLNRRNDATSTGVFINGGASTVRTVSIKKLQATERIPAMVDMFDGIDDIIMTLSTLILPANTDESTFHCDLEQPQNTYVHEILRGRLTGYKKQIQWRSTKALAILLKQMPSLSSTLANVDAQLVSNVAQLLASEDALALSKATDNADTSMTIRCLQNRWLCLKKRQMFLEAEEAIDVTLDQQEAPIRDEVVRRLGEENALSWGIDALQSPRRTVQPANTAPFLGPDTARNGKKKLGVGSELPFGTWGVLNPLPPLNENENDSAISASAANAAGVSYTPFLLSTPIVRVGRAADSCDLIINDRSVSGRHFHLRRLRREGDTGEEVFELQDFSKNGTIVNGIRVHGTSVRITPGSRVSLILSRGGLVTYEFQVRAAVGGTTGATAQSTIALGVHGGGRLAPPPIITGSSGALPDGHIPVPGQEYQQPQMTPQSLVVPRSPAEIQNRGSATRSLVTPPESRMQGVRSRLGATQGLTLITSIAESEVPRALISPNPAVDSPRVGGFNSPRSSVLQLPGTPIAGTPPASMCRNMIPPGLLSPASFQQRSETFGEAVIPGIGGVYHEAGAGGDALRIALGRDSVLNRGEPGQPGQPPRLVDELAKTRVMRASGETLMTRQSSSMAGVHGDERGHIVTQLLALAQDEGIELEEMDCEEALRIADGNADFALTLVREMVTQDTAYSASAMRIASMLGKSDAVCAEALRQCGNSVGGAIRLLLSPHGSEIERIVTARAVKVSSARRPSYSDKSWERLSSESAGLQADPLLHFQEISEENASYALLESSALSASLRGATRPNASPHKRKGSNEEAEVASSNLSLWADCNMNLDDKIRHMSLFEVEQEEDAMWEQLTSSYARQVLLQIVRLFGNGANDPENPIRELGEQLTLRRLIAFADTLKPTWSASETDMSRSASGGLQDSHRQKILARLSTAFFTDSTARTVNGNLSQVYELARLTHSIDFADDQASQTATERLICALLKMTANGNESAGDASLKLKLLEDISFDTVMHIASRTYVNVPPTASWEAGMQRGVRSREVSAPKGPIALSSGLEAMVVVSYERVWSIPPPDPLMSYRHRWRKRHSNGTGAPTSAKPGFESGGWAAKSAADQAVTLWRPVLPPRIKSASTRVWFSLGDIVKYGNDSPSSTAILVCDDGSGLLLPPVGYERVDVTGKGLPINSDGDEMDLRRKQQRSVWWPIAPPGYVAVGCVAGSKEDPLEPPKLSAYRCVREDLVRRVNSFHCVWRSRNTTPGSSSGRFVDIEDVQVATKNQADSGQLTGLCGDQRTLGMDDIVVETSLWSIDADFCGALVPVITLNDLENSEPSVAFSLNLSDDDKVLCAPVPVRTVLAFVEATLFTYKLLASDARCKPSPRLCPEMASSLFALIRHVLAERLPDSVSLAVDLLRALISTIQSGGTWRDKDGLLFCRSKIMALNQDQESGGVMLSSLLQALVELMLVVEEQDREERLRELSSCMHKDGSISLPYRFHFAKEPFIEMMVSHSSKMNVTRHFSGEERKFSLDYRGEDGGPSDVSAGDEATAHASEFYSCRFEHTPELIMTMNDKVKAEVVYFEVTVVEWGGGVGGADGAGGVAATGGTIGLGFSPPEFPLEGALVGQSLLESGSLGTRSFSFSPTNGKVQCCADASVDRWRWNEQQVTMTSGGDIIGCGLRLDTREIFFTRNGQMLGTAFSSIASPRRLHPTISVNADCKLLINFGASLSAVVAPSATGLEVISTHRTSFVYRFHSLDCENVMGAFEWFEQLSEVFGVMKALMDPQRSSSASDNTASITVSHDVGEGHISERSASVAGLLPDEFLLSADNFLSDISEDVCIRVESAHPYDLDLQEALVSIPLATSIRVKLDPRCETANSHCLQILQGGEMGDSSSGSSSPTAGSSAGGESEVRAFTGVCGAQEVTLDGDSFVWRFPVQSNFQCRVDRVRKGPYLKLENRDTRLSLVRDKGWQTAIGVARFDSGVHVWEVRISFVTASSNIFLGVARKDVRLDSYLGKDNRGWGWIGNRALWHNGSKQRGTYGEKFKTGDVVRLTLDLRRGTLSYALNGKDLGVAFGPGGTGPKLEGTFYPGFALYNQRDSIDLIGGHRVEDGGGLGNLEGDDDGTLMRSGSGGLVTGEDMYYSEEEDDEMIGGASSGDMSIPNFRMELAIVLSQMGFPMEWCVYALKNCDDDAEQAADFILANMHNMEALVREEAETFARRARQRQLLSEHAALSAAASAALSASDTLPPPPPISIGALSETRAEAYTTDPIAADDSSDAVRLAPTDTSSDPIAASSQVTPQAVDKWGIAFTAVPEFSTTGRRLLATKYRSKLERLHASQAVFTHEHDCAIVAVVNEVCEARAEALLSCDPLRMTPEEFTPSDEHLRRFPCLHGVPLEHLQKRFLILRNFNCRLQNSLAFIDFSVCDREEEDGYSADDQGARQSACRSLLARGVRALRGVVFQHVKLAWWLTVLKDQQAPAAARPEIEIDRGRARDATEATGGRDSVYAQVMDQLHALQPSLLRGADRAFKCQFVGEFGDDFGGLYRECLAHMSAELQARDVLLPVLRPCPNAVNAVGENRELFVPNEHLLSTPRCVAMAEFLGKLMGIAVRTKTPLDLNLPAVFWKLLVNQRVHRDDIESIHQGCFQVVDTIRDVDRHGITASMFDEIVDATFTVLSSSRERVELLPGGASVQVTWDDKDSYASGVESYRLGEFAPVCAAVLRGLATILPAPTLPLFTWHELRTLVCGKPTVDVDLLRRRTIYGDGCQATDPHIAYFWDVLGEFTDEQKSSFLRFVWGRSRLPTHAADFTQDFKIAGLPKAAGRADMYLPIAHTCFFSIDLPPYTSREVMRDKLLYAITNCQSIDADNTTVAQRAGQGLNWTNAAATTTATATAAISSVMAGMASALAASIDG